MSRLPEWTGWILLFALGVSGCVETRKAAPSTANPLTPIQDANTRAEDSARKLDGAIAQAAARAKASIVVAQKYNERNPAGNPRTIVGNELQVAASEIPVPADPQALIAAGDRALAVEQGRTQQAEKSVREAIERADASAKELGALRAERDAALASAKAATAQAEADLAENTRRNQAALDQARTEMDNLRNKLQSERQAWIVNGTRIAGIGLMVLGVLLIALTKGQELIRGLMLAAGGALMVGVAIVINQPAFPWVFGAAIGLTVLGFGWWLWSEWRERKRLEAMKAEKDLLEQTASTFVEQVDALEKEDPAAASKLQEKLKGPMDQKHKSLVRTLRAKNELRKNVTASPPR